MVTAPAPNAGVLIAARVLQSVGGCSGLVLGRAIVRDQATADRAAAQLALLTLVMSTVPAIAPVIGGYATAYLGWRSAFALLALFGALAFGLVLLRLPETLEAHVGGRGFGRARCCMARRGCCARGRSWATRSAGLHHHVVLRVHVGLAVHLREPAAPPPQQIGLYYLVLMGGVALGGFCSNRMAGRVQPRIALRIANGLAIAAAAAFCWPT